MTDANSVDMLLRVLAFGLPIAALAVLLALLMGRKTSKASRPTRVAVDATPAAAIGLVAIKDAAPALEALIADAEARGDVMVLAPLFLDLARREHAAGNVAAQMAALRSAAGFGSLHGPRSVHAKARIELAEIAVAGGDLTSACEQWQLARTALHEDGDKDGHARVEKTMRDNGCPTDWVLTDF